MILSDDEIAVLCSANPPMISPYVPQQVRNGDDSRIAKISFGQSSYGYDIRLGLTLREYRMPKASPAKLPVIDPKLFDVGRLLADPSPLFSDESGSYFLLSPEAYALGVSVETFYMPDNVMGWTVGKSTLARAGLECNVTPIEPGWRGQLTLELKNLTAFPIKLYQNEGIAQIIFLSGRTPLTTYSDREGKYQDQRGLTPPRI